MCQAVYGGRVCVCVCVCVCVLGVGEVNLKSPIINELGSYQCELLWELGRKCERWGCVC